MKSALLVLAALLFATPVKAETAFGFSCKYSDPFGFEGTQHFMLDLESGNGYQYDPETDWEVPVIWFEVGNSIVILDGEDTTLFIAAFNAEASISVAPWEEPNGLNRGTCTVGAD
jgi:hypothetical protein